MDWLVVLLPQEIGAGDGIMGFNKIRVNATATKILGDNANRQSLIITNGSTSGICFLGPDDTISSSNAGTILDAFGTLSEDGGGYPVYAGDVYGIATSSSLVCDVFVWERIK